jgi:hypothetical protein
MGMKDRFVVKDIGEEGVMVYDQKRDEVHFLNPAAYLILTLSREGKSLSDIEKVLSEKFHTESEKDIFIDIKACVRELKEKELLASSSQTRSIQKTREKKQS